MVKRLCPFDDFQPQMKIHVGDFEMTASRDEDMSKVYEKTRNLLFESATQPVQNSTNQTKLSSQSQPQENICQGCKSVNFLQFNQCWFCDKSFCNSCVFPCCLCFQVFCRDCSTLRYGQNDENTVCLSCSSN